MKKALKNISIIALGLLFAIRGYAQSLIEAGVIDSSYGVNGMDTSSRPIPSVAAVQKDGKAIGINAGTVGNSLYGFAAIRIKEDGRGLDSTFGKKRGLHLHLLKTTLLSTQFLSRLMVKYWLVD